MIKVRNRVISGILSGLLILSLCGCNNSSSTPNSVGEKEGENTVVAEINGKPVTRGEVGEDLRTSEEEVISQYIYDLMLDEFLKDVEVTDAELNLQMEIMKNQVGEESWPMYLVYYGGGSEETFKVMLKKSLRQEKLISQKAESITLTEEELETEYNKDPDSYNIAVLDVIFFSSVEQLNQARTLYNEGKTLEEIATEMELTVSSDEHTYFKSENLTWNKEFSDCAVGDIILSNSDSGSLVIGRIKQLNQGLDSEIVRQDLEETLKHNRGYEAINNEYIDFLKTQTVTIMGNPYSLYQEQESENETDNQTNNETNNENG